ncbi:MAG TPA: hypothetical protein ENJ75_02555 [Candidatus Kaiserbacteria bacterium]|nr:hypothetical protein [Candidatus Kaiserbacteria bacterium]
MKDPHVNTKKNIKTLKINDTVSWVIIALVVFGSIYLFGIQSDLTQKVIAPTVSTSTKTTASKKVHSVNANKSVQTKYASSGKTTTVQTQSNAKYVGTGSLLSLFKYGESLVCTVKTTSAYTKRSGTVYIADRELSGDFSSYVNGELTDTKMVDNGSHIYVWSKNSTNGVTVPAPLLSGGSAIISAGGISLSEDVGYRCNLWKKESSQFAVPSNITFTSPGS